MIDLKSSVAFISGTSRGLGQSLALQFLDQGADVIGIGRTSTIEHSNYQHVFSDLSDLEQIQSFTFKGYADHQSVILINNSGRLGKVAPFQELEEDDIVKTSVLNFIAPILLIKKFLDLQCNESTTKYVLNVGTGAAFQAIDGWSMYCSSKAGLSMFSNVIHLESQLDRAKCKIVDLAPGIMDTQMQKEIRDSEPSDFSNVEKFVDYKKDGDLQTADQTAELIIRNFEKLFNKNTASDTIRNYT